MDETELASLIGGEGAPAPVEQAPQDKAPEPAPQPAGDQGATQAAAPSRDDKGRFAPKGETPPAPAAPPSAASPPEPGHVPLAAMLDEREKRKALEAKLAEVEARQREAAAARTAEDLPPEARAAQQRYADNLRISRKFADKAYGAETMAEVHAWAEARCDADPLFNQKMLTSDDPYEDAYKAWRQDQLLNEVSPDDLDDYRAWKAQKAAQSQAAVPASPPAAVQAAASAPAPVRPPPASLAHAPNAGGRGATEVPVGAGEAFKSLFSK